MKYFPEKLTCTWIQANYENGSLTPEELVEEIIARAEKNEEKNIWIVKPSHQLINQYVEDLPKKSEETPLWGIPFAIKDNIDLAGVPTTAACPEYSYMPEKSAFVVEKLIQAGAIPVGKTNLDQFATGLVGTRSPYGEVHNAYQPELISGGSSSGSAVSVALGMAAFALGTDTAGSGRVPAMLNTLVGYKPPLGSWSTSGVVPACASLDCVTVFAENLEEAKLVDSVAAGYDKDCVWSRHYEKQGSKMPKVIYLPKEEPEFFGSFAENYRRKWNRAVKRIQRLGCKVEYIDYTMFRKAASILYDGAYVAERWEDLKEFVENHPGKTFPVTESILRSGAKEENTAAKLFGNLHELQFYRHRTQELLKDAVMVMPTAGGTFTRDEVRKNPIQTNSLMGLYTNHCNLLELAAVAVPENSRDKSYPFGITIFGIQNAEHLVCKMAEEFLRSENVEFAVCGLHKRGFALEGQLIELGAEFLRQDRTAACYKLYKLDTTPIKPGMIKTLEGGRSIEVDIYSIAKEALGRFLDHVQEPLTIGSVELEDGSVVKGFLCEDSGVHVEIDNNKFGGFEYGFFES